MSSNTATSSIGFYANGKFMSGQTSETVVSNVLRSEMSSGFAKQSKRASKLAMKRSVVYLYSAAEYEQFKAWHINTAKCGSLFFVYTDPLTGNTADWRMVNGTYEATPVNARANYFYVTMELESYVNA